MNNENKQITMPSSEDSSVIKFGLIVIFTVFFMTGGWMAFSPLATSVVASGQVSADANKKTVQHLEGGIVKDILVKDGDYVNKGDTIIVLDSTQIEASLRNLKNQYYESIARMARLEAQKNKSLSIKFPQEILEIKNRVDIKKIIRGQRNILVSKIKSLEEETLVTKKRISQFENQIDGLTSKINSDKQSLESIQTDIDEQEELFKDELVDIKRLRELRRQEIQLNGEIASANSEILRIKDQIEETKSMERLRNKEFYNEIANSMVETRISIMDLQSKIDSLVDKLNRIEIDAPVSGYVTGMEIHTVGGVVPASKPILDIVPKHSELFLVGQVKSADIDKLKVGLLADTRFSAFNMQQTTVVESKVVNISADTFINEQTGEPYYEVKLILTEKGVQQLAENQFFLLPGMPAEIMIKVGDRTTLSYLVKPFTDMLSRSFNEE